MAYDLYLAEKIDDLIDPLGNIVKKKMFGGVGYMLDGNYCFCVHKEFLVIRTSKEKADELLENEDITPFDFTGKPMKGGY